MLVRAAQRAGLAGLQGVAVLGQALDALLLQEQGLLVRDLFLDALVLLPQGLQRCVLRPRLCLSIAQFLLQRSLLARKFAALRGLGFCLAPQVQAVLLCLLARAQLGHAAAALKALRLFVLRVLECGAGAGLGVCGGLDLGRAGFGALRHAGLFGIQLAQGLLLAGRLLLLAGAQLELLAPAAQALAQQGMGGMLGAELFQRLVLGLLAGQGVLRGLGQAGGQGLGMAVLQQQPGLGLLFVLAHLLQLLAAVIAGCGAALPGLVQRLQRLRGLVAGQAFQFGRGLLQCLGGVCAAGASGLQCLGGLGQLLLPLVLGLGAQVVGLQRGLLRHQAVGLGLQGIARLGRQQLHAIGLGLELVQALARIAGAFEDFLRDEAVYLGACQLFQQAGADVGIGFKERRKAALGQQHGLGEALEVQPRDGGGLLQLVARLAAEDAAVATGQFHLGRLQRAIEPVACAALAPEGAVDLPLDLEFDLGQAVGRVARHEVVGRCRDVVQPGCLVVQR